MIDTRDKKKKDKFAHLIDSWTAVLPDQLINWCSAPIEFDGLNKLNLDLVDAASELFTDLCSVEAAKVYPNSRHVLGNAVNDSRLSHHASLAGKLRGKLTWMRRAIRSFNELHLFQDGLLFFNSNKVASLKKNLLLKDWAIG